MQSASTIKGRTYVPEPERGGEQLGAFTPPTLPREELAGVVGLDKRDQLHRGDRSRRARPGPARPCLQSSSASGDDVGIAVHPSAVQPVLAVADRWRTDDLTTTHGNACRPGRVRPCLYAAAFDAHDRDAFRSAKPRCGSEEEYRAMLDLQAAVETSQDDLRWRTTRPGQRCHMRDQAPVLRDRSSAARSPRFTHPDDRAADQGPNSDADQRSDANPRRRRRLLRPPGGGIIWIPTAGLRCCAIMPRLDRH